MATSSHKTQSQSLDSLEHKVQIHQTTGWGIVPGLWPCGGKNGSLPWGLGTRLLSVASTKIWNGLGGLSSTNGLNSFLVKESRVSLRFTHEWQCYLKLSRYKSSPNPPVAWDKRMGPRRWPHSLWGSSCVCRMAAGGFPPLPSLTALLGHPLSRRPGQGTGLNRKASSLIPLAAPGQGINLTGLGIQATLFWTLTGESTAFSFSGDLTVTSQPWSSKKIWPIHSKCLFANLSPHLDFRFPYGRHCVSLILTLVFVW